MHTNFDLKPIATASDQMPASLSLARFLAICAIAICLSTTPSAASVQMTFDGVNGTQAFGAYVSPYFGTMDGTPVVLFCVDFSNEVQLGQQWNANLTQLSPGADLGDTRFGAEPDALQLYEQAAWLSLQFASQPTSQYGDIQATIWQLFDPDAPTPSSSYWLQQAGGNYASTDYGAFYIVTNTGPVQQYGQVQEFLTEILPVAAPEPDAQLLIGLVLLAAGCVLRRRRRTQ
jgi:MYXO-CTERM domain-containing protein